MKINYIILLLFISVSTFAQIAESAEEISPLLIGEKIPEIEITSAESRKISLGELVRNQPAILLFYRGGWCPFCNAHLAEVGEITAEIKALGYQIIAVSPDSPEQLKASLAEQDLDYELFSDADGTLTQAMGLAFKSPEKYGSMLGNVSGGKNTGFLPVPALFVLGTEGTILFEYISPNYKQRIAAPLLLEVLKHFSSK
ncbi:peroxiredoxin-like family protein [Gillisia limnaea]|uniref:thioredoxin-dependent peroxiredoxin n=1 Tax=Gillisia limnaea (strain DSM 15749 / LMG 21470 / R-8282) TaxID=865937 RepID=H2BW20_GILLR|nr:peroxiredoxin-like family protein [Gillisia limnaea]EHQ02937.1 alkyl hydroperoxide reductase/ Thiol specific antioxidant/ Mal allergen [Gillisia limnaea DSM 15749]